jgi:hypothetical protein
MRISQLFLSIHVLVGSCDELIEANPWKSWGQSLQEPRQPGPDFLSSQKCEAEQFCAPLDYPTACFFNV